MKSTSRLKVYIPEPKEIDPKAVKLLQENNFEVTFDKDPEAQAIFIKTFTVLDKKYLSAFPKLRFILRAGVGLDNIDLKECKKRKIAIISSPGSNSNAVAEYVILAALTLLRNINSQTKELENGRWRNPEYMGTEIKGKVIGLLGCGAIGKIVAGFFSSLGAEEVLGYDPYLDKDELQKYNIKKSSFASAIKNADILCIHVPLTDETSNLISKKELALMKDGALLINASRGGIVNEHDLIDALKEGKKIKVALDVFEEEPAVKDELIKFENVITTPHIASYTSESQEQMSLVAAENFLKLVSQK